MDYLNTPSNYNSSSHKKAFSPTTANSKRSSPYRSTSNLMDGVRSEINNIIAQAQEKKNASNMAISAVYQTNEELMAELDPQRNLRLENQQLRRELNQALREIMRLRKIIGKLENQNNMLRNNAYYNQSGCGNQLMNDLDELRAEG